MDDDALNERNIEEDLEDLEHVQNWSEGAALWSTDWTAETVLSQLSRGNIDLNPSFQRRSAWADKKQSLFIESLILGLPIPQLILAEDKRRKGAFIVIDGKQRLLAIRRFASSDDEGDFKPLKLSGLTERPDLNKNKYSDLLNKDEFAEELSAFQNSSIRTIVIRNWKTEAYLWEVFLRINTGSVQLSPQELRQALHPGEFSNFVDQASGDSDELRLALGLNQPDFRMRDAEILLRFISYKNFIQQYNGNLKQFLDKTTEHFNARWEVEADRITDQVKNMNTALSFTRKIFGDDKYLRKWNGEKFEAKKNRAVFDIMLHFFSEKSIRDAVSEKGEELVQRFVQLCENDADFLGSIERTTKSIEANLTRFNKWREVLVELSDIEIAPVEIG